MSLVILFLILIFLGLVLFFFCVTFFTLLFTRGVPFISTPKKYHDLILKASDIRKGERVYDLGCGKASFLIRATKKGALGYGYEISLWPYIWARLNVWLNRVPVKIYFRNFFKADLSNADVVFCYLFPEVMADLEQKFLKELKPGSRVVSHAFKMPNIEPAEVLKSNDVNPELSKILVYRF